MSRTRTVVLRSTTDAGYAASIDEGAARLSNLVAEKLDEDDEDEPKENVENATFVLPFASETITDAVEFMRSQHEHREREPYMLTPTPLPTSFSIDELKPAWTASFIKSIASTGGFARVLRLTSIAHYLDVPLLQDLCATFKACAVRGKTPSEIKALFETKRAASSSSPAAVKRPRS